MVLAGHFQRGGEGARAAGFYLRAAEQAGHILDSKAALARAPELLHAWAQRQRQASAYSIEDIYRADAGKLLIPCLRFTAEFGKRGYEVIDSPLVASKGPSGFRVEATSN